MCIEPAACGGDIAGQWKIVSNCSGASDTSTAACPGEAIDFSGYKVGGEMTFAADKTYSFTLTANGFATITTPTACLMQAGATVTCAQLQGLYQNAVAANPKVPIQSTACMESGANCTCKFVYSGASFTLTGTYSTAGGVLTTTDSGSTTNATSGYCVQGDTLTITSDSSSGMSTSTNVTPSVVTLQKQ